MYPVSNPADHHFGFVNDVLKMVNSYLPARILDLCIHVAFWTAASLLMIRQMDFDGLCLCGIIHPSPNRMYLPCVSIGAKFHGGLSASPATICIQFLLLRTASCGIPFMVSCKNNIHEPEWRSTPQSLSPSSIPGVCADWMRRPGPYLIEGAMRKNTIRIINMNSPYYYHCRQRADGLQQRCIYT
jgi:hypothetical protein